MSSDSSEPSEGSRPLPKATVPVELAPKPAQPSAAPGPATDAPELLQQQEPEPVAAEPAVQATARPAGLGQWIRSLSVLEKSCCGLILLAVIVFAATVFVPALFDFPKDTTMMKVGDFPVSGKQVEVLSAEAFWRKPAEEGEAPQVDFYVIPEIQIKLSGEGVARVLFRDSEGKLAGDPVTIELKGEQEVTAISTTGFVAAANYAAYRANELEPWTAELHEAPAGADEPGDFTLLFKMSIPATLK